MRPKIFARLLVAFVLAASPAFVSVGCSKPDLGKTAGARLSPRADGGAVLVVDGWPLAGLSREDVAGRATIELSYVPGSDAVAFRTVDGKWINLVSLGPTVKRGPVTDAPQDFPTVVGGLVATEPDAANVLSQVLATKGKGAVAAVLGKAAAAEGKSWEERLEALSEEERRELVKVLEGALLDLTSPPRVVTRALGLVDVAALPEEKLLARVEPAVTSKDAKEPEGTFVASVVLRVLAQKKSAGKLACKGLTSRTWKLDEPSPDRRLLLDAMLMEWRLQRGSAQLDLVAIVDASPRRQYLYPEFALFRELFRRHGYRAEICDPGELVRRDGCLWLRDEAVETRLLGEEAIIRGIREACGQEPLDHHERRGLFASGRFR